MKRPTNDAQLHLHAKLPLAGFQDDRGSLSASGAHKAAPGLANEATPQPEPLGGSVCGAKCVKPSRMREPRQTTARVLRSITVALVLVFVGAQAALPHVHVTAAHESELCAGHMSDETTPALEHAGSCLLCRSGKRHRNAASSPALSFDTAGGEPVAHRPDEAPQQPAAVSRGSASPRAPPHRSVI
jgi:hypothetical protein